MARVLVVEDDGRIADMIAVELGSREHFVDIANNGQEALTRIESARPDVIVLDVLMPVLSGWDFIEQYRNRTDGQPIPIIVLSAAGAVSRSMEAMASDALSVSHSIPCYLASASPS